MAVELENTIDHPLQVVYQPKNGAARPIALAAAGEPGARKLFKDEIAELFLQDPAVARLVRVVGRDYESESLLPGRPTTMWLANLTGNPEYEDTVPMRVVVKGREEVNMLPNPLKKAITISREMKGGQREYKTRFGYGALNMGATQVKLPPYTRKEFPRSVGQWFRHRSNVSAPVTADGRRHSNVLASRPPSNFEPDLGWTLDDMSLYLKLCDPKLKPADLPPTESEIRKRAGDDDVLQDQAVLEEKQQLFQRLFFRLIDPKIPLPTYERFQLMKGEKPAASVPAPEAAVGPDVDDLIAKSLAETGALSA